MTSAMVQTICGAFDRRRIDSLKAVLRQAELDGLDRDQIVKFEGHDYLISFANYLVEYVDGELNMQESGL